MIPTSESLQAAFGYLTANELAALKQLAQSLPDNPVVVNIGAGAGTSGLAFMESRPDLKLVTVDVQMSDSPFGCLYAEQQALQSSGYGFPFDDRYYQIQGDSKAVGRDWQKWNPGDGGKEPINLVFIDADHSYRGAKGDILAWLPNIKPGGIIAVHDYDKKRVYASGQLSGKVMHPLPWPGVDRAVRKFLCPFFEIALHVDTLISFWVTEEGLKRLNDSMG